MRYGDLFNNIFNGMRYEDAGVVDIELVRGSDCSINFNGWTKDDAIWDLTNENIRCEVKPAIDIRRYADVSLAKSDGGITVDTNNLTLHFKGEEIAKLKGSTYFYDIVIDDIAYIRGRVILSGRVTR